MVVENFEICTSKMAKMYFKSSTKAEEKFEIQTNFTNCIELNNKLIKPEIFLITKSYLGVPMFISVKNKHISFEHTHPPHEYILSKNKFKKIKELKKEINEIVN